MKFGKQVAVENQPKIDPKRYRKSDEKKKVTKIAKKSSQEPATASGTTRPGSGKGNQGKPPEAGSPWARHTTFHAFLAFHATTRHDTPRHASPRRLPRHATPRQSERSWVDFWSQHGTPNPRKSVKSRCQDAFRLGFHFWIDC